MPQKGAWVDKLGQKGAKTEYEKQIQKDSGNSSDLPHEIQSI